MSWAEKNLFCEQSSKSNQEPCKEEVPGDNGMGDAVRWKWSKVAGPVTLGSKVEGRPQSGSGRDYVRDNSQAWRKVKKPASWFGCQGLLPGFLTSFHHTLTPQREVWSLLPLIKTQSHHEDPTLLILRKSQQKPGLIAPLYLRVAAFRTEIHFR